MMVPIHLTPTGSPIPLVMGKWDWTCNRSSHLGDRRIRNYKCLGGLRCSNSDCHRPVHAKLRPADVARDLAIPCTACGGKLEYIQCSTKASQIESSNHPGLIEFTHNGDHSSHAAEGVPGGKPIMSQDIQVTNIIVVNPSTSVVALRAGKDLGDPAIRRPPVAEVAPQLNNLDVFRRKVQSIRGSLPSVSLGSQLTADSAQRLMIVCPDFIQQHETLDGDMVIMQTPFMKDLLTNRKLVQEREINSEVTDAAHKDFTLNGKLITMSVYCLELHHWVPILFAYTRFERIVDYTCYFRYILAVLGLVHTDIKILLERYFQMVDFSAAQNAGIIQAWVDHNMEIFDLRSQGVDLAEQTRIEKVTIFRDKAHKARAG